MKTEPQLMTSSIALMSRGRERGPQAVNNTLYTGNGTAEEQRHRENVRNTRLKLILHH